MNGTSKAPAWVVFSIAALATVAPLAVASAAQTGRSKAELIPAKPLPPPPTLPLELISAEQIVIETPNGPVYGKLVTCKGTGTTCPIRW